MSDQNLEPDVVDDVLLACRYGDLDDVKAFIDTHDAKALENVRDERGNTVLHMIAANGHDDVLEYLLSLPIPTPLLSVQNESGSTALHWASVNSHLSILKRIIEYPDGPGINLIDIKNTAGRTPLGEAELADWEEGAAWLVSVMNLESGAGAAGGAEDKDGTQEGDEDETIDPDAEIEVQVEDAEGQISTMSIRADGKPVSSPTTTTSTTNVESSTPVP